MDRIYLSMGISLRHRIRLYWLPNAVRLVIVRTVKVRPAFLFQHIVEA
jgi:hypothetical protein